jgi:hypothetical protein
MLEGAIGAPSAMRIIFNRVTNFGLWGTIGSVFLSFRLRFLLKANSPREAKNLHENPQPTEECRAPRLTQNCGQA